jgi:hypothetical protein
MYDFLKRIETALEIESNGYVETLRSGKAENILKATVDTHMAVPYPPNATLSGSPLVVGAP